MSEAEVANIYALFQKRLAGDDALLLLAGLRLREARLGGELYAADPGELEQMLAFVPRQPLPVVHLPRGVDLLTGEGRELVLEMARQAGGRVRGLVVHDQTALVGAPEAYRAALAATAAALVALPQPTWLFVEYAVGLRPEEFCRFFVGLDLPMVSLCLDLGHLASWQAGQLSAQARPGEELEAVEHVVATVAGYFPLLAGYAKPIHLHLHDGHPLAPGGPYGVSDHLGFFAEIPLASPYQGRYFVPPIYGPLGLRTVVRALRRQFPARQLSWTMEIHPHGGRLPLGEEAAELFPHWRDFTTAEETNFWLDELLRNCRLLARILAEL